MRLSVRDGIIAAAFVILTVFAIWGWSRRPSPASANSVNGYAVPSATTQPLDAYGQPINANSTNPNVPVANNPNVTPAGVHVATGDAYPANDVYPQYADQQPPPGAPAPCLSQAYYAEPLPMFASRGYVRTIHEGPPPIEAHYVEGGSADRAYYRPERERVHGRSTKKSVAIVAGSAGAGAAIGALAGGGKGAGIGALAGGAGGFIYDRLTHKHVH